MQKLIPNATHQMPQARKVHDGMRFIRLPVNGRSSASARMRVARPPMSQMSTTPMATPNTRKTSAMTSVGNGYHLVSSATVEVQCRRVRGSVVNGWSRQKVSELPSNSRQVRTKAGVAGK